MSTNLGVEQSGKSGGDALGYSSAGSVGAGGSGIGTGMAAGFGAPLVDAYGIGVGGGADTYAASAGALGGDVGDNTAIGSINISS